MPASSNQVVQLWLQLYEDPKLYLLHSRPFGNFGWRGVEKSLEPVVLRKIVWRKMVLLAS